MSPGRVKAADLPPEVRRKLVGRAARPAPVRTRPTIQNDDEAPCRWRCHNCGAIFARYTAAERHQNQPGHRRVETWIGEDW